MAREVSHMSMSDDPAGFRRGQPNDRRPPQGPLYAEDRRFAGGSESQGTQRYGQHQNAQNSQEGARRATMRPPSAYTGYTIRPEQRTDPRFEPRQNPREEGYAPSFGGQTRRSETVRPGWDQPQPGPAPHQPGPAPHQPGPAPHQPSPAPQAYPAYPGPSAAETQRYTQPQSYYPQSAEPYNPAPAAQPAQGGAQVQEDASGGYGQYETGDFYRQTPNDYQTQAYASQTYERGPATERYSVQQAAAPKTMRESYYQPDSGDLEQHGLMGGEPATQRYSTQAPLYETRRESETRREPLNDGQQENLDPRAGNYPIARTHDDELDADFFGEDDDFDIEDEEERPRGRTKLIAAVLASAVLIGGGGFYYFKSARPGGDSDGEPPTFADNGGPVKDAPADPGGRKFGNGGKTIYDRLLPGDGEASTARNGRFQQASVAGGGGRSGDDSIDNRIERAYQAAKGQSGGGAPAQSAQSSDEVEPLQVKTFRVNPDGSTMEPASESSAPNQVANADGYRARSFPRTAPQGTPVQGAAAASGSEGAASMGRSMGGQQPEVVARVDAAPVANSVAGGYYVQVGARNDQNQALAALADVQSKYGSVLGGYAPVIRRADLGAKKGVWYRVWVGPIENKDGAANLCDRLKNAGLKACMVRKE
jgi:cell division protein FtsN